MTNSPPTQNGDPAELQRLVDEQRHIAEIGRLVGSTLDIADVFPQVAGIARELVSADRMVIAFITEDGSELVDQFIDGAGSEDQLLGMRTPVKTDDPFNDLLHENTPYVRTGKELENFNKTSPDEQSRQALGLKSPMLIPLVWQGSSYGLLTFRAFDPDAFGDHQIELGQQIATQVAGGVASANQYAKLERESLEKEQLANIRRIAGSSLDLAEIFTPFAKQARLLIPADRVILTAMDSDGTVIDRYVDGIEIRDSKTPLKSIVLDAEIIEQIRVNRSYFLANGEQYEKYVVDRPEELARYAVGLRAMLSIPLVWRGELVGSLTFRSTDPDAFSDRDIETAELVSNQIASAIHASNQYRLLEKESLNRKRLGEIGRIVSSTLELNSVFSAFVDTVRELIPFDRLTVSTIDPVSGRILASHISGQSIAQTKLSSPISLEKSIVPASVYRDHQVLVSNAETLAKRSKTDIASDNRSRIAEGFISAMIVPVVLQGDFTGTIIFRSTEADPYNQEHVELAEQIAAQIAGVIASSQQRSLLQAESTDRRRLADEQSRIAEIGRIVNSTLDLNEVYSLVVEQARELLPFDRCVITLLSEDRQTLTDEFVEGPGDQAGIQKPYGYNPLQQHVIETGIAYVWNAVDSDALGNTEFDQHLRELGLKSILISPLKWQQEVFGLLTFRSAEVSVYDEHQLEMANQIAAQIAGAVAMSKQYQQLAISEATYRDLVESAHIIIWRMDSEGRFSYVNKAFETVLGYSSEEILGTHYWNLQSANQREGAEQRFSERTNSGVHNTGETTYISKSGAEVHLSYSSYAVSDSDGTFTGVRGVALDVTAERQARDELNIQAAAIEEASDAMVILLPDTTIGYVNNAFVEQMGYSRSEVIGQPSSILRSASSSNAVYERIWETVRAGKIWRGTIFSSRKNGSTFTIDASLNPVFGEDGSIASYVSIRRDVTERIQAEQDRQARAELDAQNQQLQEINEQRNEFFSTVSHELRTPLTAVTAFSDILSRNRSGNLTTGQLDQLDVIRRNSRSLINLVEDMLDMSRLSSRSLRIDRSSVEVDEMILSSIESLEPTAREGNHVLNFTSRTEGLSIDADKGRLVQVLSNLLTNACKYSHDGTQINVSTSTDGESVELKVSDSGFGMSAVDLKGLFSPFYRSLRDEVRVQAGTGLGMSISKTLVELHDGSIEVESVIDEGTTVTVKLPGVVNVSDSTS